MQMRNAPSTSSIVSFFSFLDSRPAGKKNDGYQIVTASKKSHQKKNVILWRDNYKQI